MKGTDIDYRETPPPVDDDMEPPKSYNPFKSNKKIESSGRKGKYKTFKPNQRKDYL